MSFARNASAVLAIGAITGAIAALDLATGQNVSLWLAYLIPIGLATVILGVSAGMMFSILAATALFEVGLAIGYLAPTLAHHSFHVWNHLAAYVIFTGLVAVAVRARRRKGERGDRDDDLHTA
jgi:hypothetical protein